MGCRRGLHWHLVMARRSRDRVTIDLCGIGDAARAAAQANGAAFLGDVSEQPWSAEDFFDQGHFRPAGSRKFALALRESIATQCGKAGPWNR